MGNVFKGDPSPKFHDQATILVALGIERSVNVVGLPRQTVSAVKSATGNGLIVMDLTIVSGQLVILFMISVTENVPPVAKVC